MVQFSAMAALDLSMAKFNWSTSILYLGRPSASEEVVHTQKVEILHRPTPYTRLRTIYNAARAAFIDVKVEEIGMT
jgi:hypothetical protein